MKSYYNSNDNKYKELTVFSKFVQNFKQKNKGAIQKFLNIDESLCNVFTGWHYKMNEEQYKVVQRLLNRKKFPTISNKFIFDIESNKYGEKKIVQIAYYVVDDNNKVIDCDMYYVFNTGVYSDYYKKVGYHTLKEYGINPLYLFDKLEHIISQCDLIIGHNILNFDCKIIKKYFEKYGLKMDLTEKKCFDTMKESKQLLNLKNKKGGAKWATLTELSDFFGVRDKSYENYHDALYDVHMTYLCYINLKKII